MQIVERPWGFYNTIHLEESSFLLKKICVKPNSKLSLQSHNHRSEHWTIISGNGRVVLGDDVLIVGPNSHVYIPTNVKHRIINTSETEDLTFVEVQVGQILEETDIVRYEDEYGRVN